MTVARVLAFCAKCLLLWMAFAVAYSRRDMWFVGLLAGFITGCIFGMWATLDEPKEKKE